MFPGFERRQRDLLVAVRRSGDDHGIEIVSQDELSEVGEGRRAVGFRRRPRARRISVGHCGKGATGGMSEGVGANPADFSGADKTEAHRSLEYYKRSMSSGSPRCCKMPRERRKCRIRAPGWNDALPTGGGSPGVVEGNQMRILLAVVVFVLPLTSLLTAADKKIVITGTPRHWWALNDEAVAQFREAAGDAEIVVALGREALASEIADADGVVGGIPRDLFAAAERLKWVQSYSAGVEGYHHWPQFVDSEVVLTNCKIVQGPTIADHALGMLLAFTRGLVHYIPNRTKEEWNRSREGLIELEGKTAVVIGFGGIGSEIARRARAFGMKVIGVDPKDIPAGSSDVRMIYPDQLDMVLPEADVVFVAAPAYARKRGHDGTDAI